MMTTHHLPGLTLTDHFFTVPLDYANASDSYGPTITVYAREAVAPDKQSADLPWLVFFQGGPGFGAPRPSDANGWLGRALKEYRVLLLDQRGTGRSSPVNQQTLARFPSARAQADYLKHFRADAIVQDAEHIRRELVGDDVKWSALGQSYGGFCITHYLSAAPEGLREVFITGGLPSLTRSADEVYLATYGRVIEQNRRYSARYPGDAEIMARVVAVLASEVVLLPSGDRLSAQRFQQIGLALGGSDGFEEIHYLLEEAFVEGKNGPELSYTFLLGIEKMQAFNTNPIFAILHESIYCQNTQGKTAASNWAAHRIREEYPEFDIQPGQSVYFTGEMIYPWMFDEYRELQPMKETAELLAQADDWPALYNLDQLRANTVPGAAAIYYDDMYVERAFSEETARSIAGLKIWVTNEYQHNGLRADGEVVLDRLIQMVRGIR